MYICISEYIVIDSMKKSIKLLFRFLKERDLYSCYINNVRLNTDLNELNKSVYNRIHEMNPECYIIAPFCWSDTVQGHSFWRGVNDAWDVYYFDNK